MNVVHKVIRERLKLLPKTDAWNILENVLPPNERDAIYYADVLRENLCYIGDMRMNCSESAVKKYRRDGYGKLAVAFYSKN